jgi:hypothetical protein
MQLQLQCNAIFGQLPSASNAQKNLGGPKFKGDREVIIRLTRWLMILDTYVHQEGGKIARPRL